MDGRWHRPNGQFASNEEMGINNENSNGHYLNRPYIRKSTLDEIEKNTFRENGMVLDNISGKMVPEDKVHLGHNPNYEFYHMRNIAESAGMTQAEFNDFMNNPKFYSWQYIPDNQSHVYEVKH